jgi:two-component system NarL family sensor kinase
MIKKIIQPKAVLVLSFFLWLSSFAQSLKGISNDSLENRLAVTVQDSDKVSILTELAIRLYKNEPEKSKQYALQGMRLAVASQNYEKEAKLLNLLGVVHSFQGNYDSATSYYFREMEIGKKHDNKSIIVKALANLGLNHYYRTNYDSALYYDLKALAVQEEMHDSLNIASNMSNIGNLYYRMESFQKAIQYLDAGLKIYEHLDNQTGIANDLNSLAAVYDDMGQVTKAIGMYERSLKIKEELNDQFGIANTLNNLAGIYSSQGNHGRALETYKKVLEIRTELDDKSGIALELFNISIELRNLEKYAEAIQYAEKSFINSRGIGDKLLLRNVSEKLAGLYFHQHNFEKAYEYQKFFKDISDSILNESKTKQVAEMETKYQTEKKEKENALLTINVALKEKQLLTEKAKFYVLSVVLIFILIISVLLYNRNQLKQKKILNEEMLKQEKLRIQSMIMAQEEERKHLAGELHDGLGQVLSAARLNVESLSLKNNGNAEPLLANTMNLIDHSFTELRNISHRMMPVQLIRFGLPSALNEVAATINKSGKIHISFDADENIPRFGSTVEINVFRIVQEWLNNIIKYSGATEVSVQLMFHDTELTVMIEDNGSGFEIEKLEKGKGNGWYNINSRLSLINGQIEVDSKLNKGTLVSIFISVGNTILVIKNEDGENQVISS